MKYQLLSGLIVLVISIQSTFSQDQVQDRAEVLNNLLKSIPSPLEMSSLIKKSGVKYNGEILNPPQNTSQYQDGYYKALNLGIYSTDLGYVNIYKNQDTIAPAYLQSIITLSDGLNIDNLINFAVITNYALSNNLNGLLSETTVSFEKINEELINQEKPELSILMLTGGWLETLYITCQIAKTHPNKVLDNRIAEQKIVLDKILPLLKSYKKGEEMEKLYQELNQLNEVFKKIKIKQKNKANANFTIEKWGDLEVVVYQNNEDKGFIKYKTEDLETILESSSVIRDKIVKNSNELMKRISILPFVLLAFLALDFVYAQCDPEFLKQKGIKKLSEESGYTFLKSYAVDNPNGKKYSYIFSQGTHYMIALANYNPDNKGIYITIYDSNNNKVATSFTEGKFFSAISFTCHKTGIYQMHFAFEDTNKYCAAGVLGMKR